MASDLERYSRLPQSSRLFAETEAWLRAPPNPRCAISANSTWANRQGDHSVLLQWHAIGKCYAAAEAAEAAGGFKYAWMLRLRTGLVYFAPVPLPCLLYPSPSPRD